MRTLWCRATWLLAAVLLIVQSDLGAQSSMFGTRAVGFPGRWLDVRSRGTGGSFGIFDPSSGLNPAAITQAKRVTVGFVAAPSRRKWETPAGDATIKETRFPLMGVVAPVPKTVLWLGVNFASYADRDFRLFTSDTIQIQAPPVGPFDSVAVFDTLQSLGGMNEIRFAAAYDRGRGTSYGAAFHLLTGSSRIDARRSFGDTLFGRIRQTAELSYHGVGFSLGIVHSLSRHLRVAAVVRSDSKATVKQDSSDASVGHIDLPYTFAGGIQADVGKKLTVAVQGVYRTWSGANSDLLVLGGIGSVNTVDLSLGGEYISNAHKPSQFPIRLGAHYAQLPFPLNAAGRPYEFAIAAGTGVELANGRAGLDFSLEQAWRSQDTNYKEQALTLSIGVRVMP